MRQFISRWFAKPLSLFQYTPWDSLHSRSCLRGIVATEFHRMTVINSLEDDVVLSINTLKDKFIRRGYPLAVLDEIVAATLFKMRNPSPPRDSNFLLVPFKIQFFAGAARLNLMQTLFEKLKTTSFADLRFNGKILKPVLCWRVGRNLFRRRYQRFVGVR